jgi:hypothetical protein
MVKWLDHVKIDYNERLLAQRGENDAAWAYPSVFPSGQEQTLGLLAPTLGQEEQGMGRRTVQGEEDGDEKPM